ncbi:MAG: SLBB domain-containing protein [Candidatus Aminicenantes bacterium]|nr:MAG: SLBB domain-containing protein [Candidatus Aminicenantes bacterium]
MRKRKRKPERTGDIKLTKLKLSVLTIGMIGLFLASQGIHSQEASRDYKIGAKDLLEIRVIGHEDASTTVRVSEGGKISMPYLKEVEVAGLTGIELEQKLVTLLGQGYFQNPQVSVFIREYRSNIVSIMGAVRNPGEYELLGRLTLMDLISKAGGPTGEEGKEIIIFRRLNGESTSLKISRDGLLYEGDPDLNVPLHPGDVINVQIDRMVHIFVTGEVRNPGMLEVRKSELPNFTLLKAIAQAGGFAERGSKSGVKIIRRNEEGRERTIKVNVKEIEKGKRPDLKLQEGDVVIVPESIF